MVPVEKDVPEEKTLPKKNTNLNKFQHDLLVRDDDEHPFDHDLSLTIAALGTLGDVETWSDTEVVFITRKLTLNVAKVDLIVNLISAKHKCGSGPDPHPGTTTTTTMGQNITLLVAPVVKKVTSEDCEHRAFRAYVTPNVTAVSSLVGNLGDARWNDGEMGLKRWVNGGLMMV
ncbi:unnamed protein product [Cladocopium goreaui]|uniref:Uncharacterized protein n=1 Tax=Cladocopium goreaui TaxID=2562237 RepID=A0A9P1CB17_9DINO|nr:unnamed protein product [Cladocopium goreaui]